MTKKELREKLEKLIGNGYDRFNVDEVTDQLLALIDQYADERVVRELRQISKEDITQLWLDDGAIAMNIKDRLESIKGGEK